MSGDGRELTGREGEGRGRRRGGWRGRRDGRRDGSVGRRDVGLTNEGQGKKGKEGCAGREDQIVEDGREYRRCKCVRGRAQVSDLSRWVANATRLSRLDSDSDSGHWQAGSGGSDQGQGSTRTKVTQSRPHSGGSARAASLGEVIVCLVVLDARAGGRADGGRGWGTGPGTRPYLYGGVGRGYHAACLVSSPPLAQI